MCVHAPKHHRGINSCNNQGYNQKFDKIVTKYAEVL